MMSSEIIRLSKSMSSSMEWHAEPLLRQNNSAIYFELPVAEKYNITKILHSRNIDGYILLFETDAVKRYHVISLKTPLVRKLEQGG